VYSYTLPQTLLQIQYINPNACLCAYPKTCCYRALLPWTCSLHCAAQTNPS
jgi:hypothetical protein